MASASEKVARTRLQYRFEKQMFRPVRDLLREHMQRAAEGVKADGAMGAEIALMGIEEEMAELLIEKNRACGIAHAQYTEKQILASLPPERKQFDAFNSLFNSWLKTEGLKEAKNISETTRRRVAKIVRDNRGKGNDEVAAIISKKSRLFSKFRAQTVSRTETHNAAGYASQTMAENTGFANETVKEWLTNLGGNPRETHRAANGQTVPLDEMFQVGGAQLMRPGDTNGIGDLAREIINCQCTTAYALASAVAPDIGRGGVELEEVPGETPEQRKKRLKRARAKLRREKRKKEELGVKTTPKAIAREARVHRAKINKPSPKKGRKRPEPVDEEITTIDFLSEPRLKITMAEPTKEFASTIKQGFQDLGANTRKALEKGGTSYHFGKTMKTGVPNLWGNPRGWGGADWDMVGGAHHPEARQVVMPQKVLRRSSIANVGGKYVTRSPTKVQGTLFHETGHALDTVLGTAKRDVSASPAFRKVYKAGFERAHGAQFPSPDIGESKQTDRAWEMSYFTQSGAAGPQEAFAEAFAIIRNKRIDRKKHFEEFFPEVLEFVEQKLRDEGLEV